MMSGTQGAEAAVMAATKSEVEGGSERISLCAEQTERGVSKSSARSCGVTPTGERARAASFCRLPPAALPA